MSERCAIESCDLPLAGPTEKARGICNDHYFVLGRVTLSKPATSAQPPATPTPSETNPGAPPARSGDSE